MTIDKNESNGLATDADVDPQHSDNQTTRKAPARKRYKLADLMSEMPNGMDRVEGWDEID